MSVRAASFFRPQIIFKVAILWIVMQIASADTNCSADVLIDHDLSIDDVLRAWKSREERYTSGSVEWTETRFIPKGAHTETAASLGVVGDAVPSVDLELKYRRRIVFSGNLHRFEHEGDEFSLSTNGAADRKEVVVWDGQVSRSLLPATDDRKITQGSVRASNQTMSLQGLTPLALFYRPFSWRLRTARQRAIELLDERGRIGNAVCLIAIIRRGRFRDEYWIDPAKDFAVLRYRELEGQNEFLRMDISFKKTAQHGWVPIGWETTAYTRKMKMRESWKAQVVEYKINSEIDPDTFHLEFPNGCWVDDDISQTQYIVRSDGSKRLVTKEELNRNITYDDLLQTESGQAGLSSRPTSILMLIIVGVAVMLVAFFAVRWWRRGHVA